MAEVAKEDETAVQIVWASPDGKRADRPSFRLKS
jgi:hypothetical protein